MVGQTNQHEQQTKLQTAEPISEIQIKLINQSAQRPPHVPLTVNTNHLAGGAKHGLSKSPPACATKPHFQLDSG